MCSYQPGFSGDICNLILTREPSCDNGGFCTGPNNRSCPTGFTGPTCSNSFECNQICPNGGICSCTNVCSCPVGFTGPNCSQQYNFKLLEKNEKKTGTIVII